MNAAVPPLPQDQPVITPYLALRNAAAAIDFYKTVFGAAEESRLPGPAGTIGHAELRIGNSRLFLSDEFPAHDALSPESTGGSPVTIHIYVEDVDGAVARAVAGGAVLLRAVKDEFYGDRAGKIRDPFGHLWFVATRMENVSREEMRRRAEALANQEQR